MKASNLQCVRSRRVPTLTPSINVPSEGYLDVVLVNGKAQVQQLQLAIVSVEEVATRGTVGTSASHVLAQPVEGVALL